MLYRGGFTSDGLRVRLQIKKKIEQVLYILFSLDAKDVRTDAYNDRETQYTIHNSTLNSI